MFIVAMLAWIAMGYLGGSLAAQKGYSPTLGVILGSVIGPTGLIVALLLPMTEEGYRQRELEVDVAKGLKIARTNRSCPQCQCTHSVVNRFCPSCMFQYPDV